MSSLRDTPTFSRARHGWLDRETETFPHVVHLSHFGYGRRLQTSKTSVGLWSYPRYPYIALGKTLDVFGFWFLVTRLDRNGFTGA